MASTLRMLLITVALCALVAAVCAAPRRSRYQGAGSSGNTETDEEKKARLQKYIDDQKVASDAWKSAKDGLDKQIEQSDPMKSANQQAPPGFNMRLNHGLPTVGVGLRVARVCNFPPMGSTSNANRIAMAIGMHLHLWLLCEGLHSGAEYIEFLPFDEHDGPLHQWSG